MSVKYSQSRWYNNCVCEYHGYLKCEYAIFLKSRSVFLCFSKKCRPSLCLFPHFQGSRVPRRLCSGRRQYLSKAGRWLDGHQGSGRLAGKIAVITGGTQPESLAIAKKLAQEEAKAVVILTAAEEDAAAVQAQGTPCHAYPCDIGNFEDVTRCFNAIKAELGDIDILINNPNAICPKTLLEMTPEDWDKVLRVNVHSMFYCCKQVFADFLSFLCCI